LQIENSQIEKPESLNKLLLISFIAAVKVLALVHARDGDGRHVNTVFNKNEIIVLKLLDKKLQGKTEKQKNKFKSETLGWASWVIARIGGWKGYKSASKPGPITIYRGLEIFYNYVEGWKLTNG